MRCTILMYGCPLDIVSESKKCTAITVVQQSLDPTLVHVVDHLSHAAYRTGGRTLTDCWFKVFVNELAVTIRTYDPTPLRWNLQPYSWMSERSLATITSNSKCINHFDFGRFYGHLPKSFEKSTIREDNQKIKQSIVSYVKGRTCLTDRTDHDDTLNCLV